MEAKSKEKVTQWISSLVGQSLTDAYRWEAMPGFFFERTQHNPTALHAYSRCIVSQSGHTLIDSEDIFVPAPGVEIDPDNDYGIGDCVFDRDMPKLYKLLPVKVISASCEDDGTIHVCFEKDLQLSCTPWGGNEYEAWRLFHPERHEGIVFHNDGRLLDYADIES